MLLREKYHQMHTHIYIYEKVYTFAATKSFRSLSAWGMGGEDHATPSQYDDNYSDVAGWESRRVSERFMDALSTTSTTAIFSTARAGWELERHSHVDPNPRSNLFFVFCF